MSANPSEAQEVVDQEESPIKMLTGKASFRYKIGEVYPRYSSDVATFEYWHSKNPCPAEEGRHGWIFEAARACRWKLHIKAESAIELIRSKLTRAEQHPGEIAHAVANVYGYKAEPGSERFKVETAAFNPSLLAERARQLSAEIRDDLPNWLASVSPANIDVGPADYLNAVFPGETVLATTNMHAKGGFVYQWPDEANEMERFVQGNRPYVINGKTFCGAWYLANPINGEWINNSIRSEANLTSFRHIVLESDAATADQWLAMLAQEPLAIVALYTSGKRSVHALVRIPADNKSQFNRIKAEFKRKYCPLGADKGAMSAVQLTRLPGVVRRDNGNAQRLLYLNPRPSVKPIWKKERS
jgi:hypothetical protein